MICISCDGNPTGHPFAFLVEGCAIGIGGEPNRCRSQAIVGLDWVAGVSRVRHAVVETAHGPVDLEAFEPAPHQPPRYRLKQGDPKKVWEPFRRGAGILVSEPYAFHFNLEPGDEITLPSGGRFLVLGVYYDYSSDRGEVLMPLSVYRDRFRDVQFTCAKNEVKRPRINSKTMPCPMVHWWLAVGHRWAIVG